MVPKALSTGHVPGGFGPCSIPEMLIAACAGAAFLIAAHQDHGRDVAWPQTHEAKDGVVRTCPLTSLNKGAAGLAA